jgi:hypothetical protein
MTVNIPGIIPGIYFFIFNNIKVYDWASSSGKDNRTERKIFMDNVYDIFNKFMTTYNLYPQPIPGYPGYQCDQLGNVFHPDGHKIVPFNSNGYKQVLIFDINHKKYVKGVHQLVSQTFDPAYYDGCIVHHRNEIKSDNYLENLEVTSRSEHSRHHADPSNLIAYMRQYGPHNKGQKMSDEFREHCRIAALNRKPSNTTYHGNQYVDQYGNLKVFINYDYNDFFNKCQIMSNRCVR